MALFGLLTPGWCSPPVGGLLVGITIRVHVGQFSLNRLSNNVGGVKHFRAHYSMHSEKSAISLSLKPLLLLYQPRLARNQVSGQELSPTHASLRSTTSIMITTSNSSVKRSGTPNQLLGVGLHTIAISGLSRVRTELSNLLVIPSLAPHPEHLNR